MRRLAAAILAAPVIASIYIATLLAVPGARRNLAAVAAVLFVGVVGVTLVIPPSASSTPPSMPPSTPRIVSSDQLQPVERGGGNDASSDGSAGSDGPGIAAATDGSLGGPAAGISHEDDPPVPGGAEATTVAIRNPTTAKLAGSLISGNRLRITAAIVLRFDRPVTVQGVRAAFSIKPPVRGTTRALSAKVYTFTPAKPLTPNAAYTVTFTRPIKDTAGIEIRAPKPMRFLTTPAPGLVRFRPLKGTADVDPASAISVRFTKPMNHVTTASAFSVVVRGKKIAGTVSWAEGNTVLVFIPSKALAEGSAVGVRVLATATSADGVPLKNGGSATFTVTPPPAPTTARPRAMPVTRGGHSGGGSVGGGAWAAAEAYYLDLMNCTRTGGWVTASGHCDSPGGRDVAPLRIDAGISAKVSRPYAKYLAGTGICSHFADGNPGTRLRRAGYDSYVWAENISCPKDMSPMALMVYTQQYFQNEKSYNGGHYVNLMNPDYDRVGIGVWVANGRAEIVIDFYRP